MSNKMLIDASHPEETRVVVVKGNRVEEFDFEAASRTQLRGNIYLAKVTRVEPSLQAAFVDYGGNRHGFLAFSEIHPDYYQIPVQDRQALLEEEAREHQQAQNEEDDKEEKRAAARKPRRGRKPKVEAAKAEDEAVIVSEPVDGEAENEDATSQAGAGAGTETVENISSAPEEVTSEDLKADEATSSETETSEPVEVSEEQVDADTVVVTEENEPIEADASNEVPAPSDSDAPNVIEASEVESDASSNDVPSDIDEDDNTDQDAEAEADSDDEVESTGAEDALEEVPTRRSLRKQYKIQEVIKRRQIILVQVVKEERGNKGAALTTYLSLAGRYSVLMPNTARGGGISRKITNQSDRKRLRKIADELEVPQGMGVILRTAGASRTKPEVRRDFEYLMRLWENVRDLTLKSSAPALVYEEGSLIKRSIRDLYNKDISEVQISGEAGYREAKDFMRMLMPSHAKNVQPYRNASPLFTRFNIEPQLDAMFSPQVTLKSGGYLVINQTEALVAIDVNSGRSTREHNIEDTAVSTNLEAAEEVARQFRLRDLAGLIVIDFIDMEENRNNRAVERKLKDCLKNDRARIQVGRISNFGLLEMSRQRIRSGVLESTMEPCQTCQGTGSVRAPSSVALHVLRSLEEHLMKHSRYNVIVKTRASVALYVLNAKRDHLASLEDRYGLTITFEADESVTDQYCTLMRGDDAKARRTPPPVIPNMAEIDAEMEKADREAEALEASLLEHEAEETESVALSEEDNAANTTDEEEGKNRKRRRRRRRKKPEDASAEATENSEETTVAETTASEEDTPSEANGTEDAGDRKRRRRGRRGGRKTRRDRDNAGSTDANVGSEGEVAADVQVASTDAPVTADAVATVSEATEAPSAEPEAPKATPKTTRKKTTPIAETVAREEAEVIVDTPQAAPSEPATSTTPTETTEEDKKPRRGGWWQRGRNFF